MCIYMYIYFKYIIHVSRYFLLFVFFCSFIRFGASGVLPLVRLKPWRSKKRKATETSPGQKRRRVRVLSAQSDSSSPEESSSLSSQIYQDQLVQHLLSHIKSVTNFFGGSTASTWWSTSLLFPVEIAGIDPLQASGHGDPGHSTATSKSWNY